jgi:hypothetical protein
MRRGEEASGRLRALLSLAFLAALAYVAVKILPAYYDNFQLQDHIRQLTTQVAVRTKPVTPAEIEDEVMTFAQDHGITLAPENVKVTISRHISISLEYTVPVDLTVYTLRLHFKPSADSPSL